MDAAAAPAALADVFVNRKAAPAAAAEAAAEADLALGGVGAVLAD